jgi:hypothetical protein
MHQSPVIHPRQPARPAAQKQCAMRDARTQHAAHRRYYPIPSPSSPSPWALGVGCGLVRMRIPDTGLPHPGPFTGFARAAAAAFYQPPAKWRFLPAARRKAASAGTRLQRPPRGPGRPQSRLQLSVGSPRAPGQIGGPGSGWRQGHRRFLGQLPLGL